MHWTDDPERHLDFYSRADIAAMWWSRALMQQIDRLTVIAGLVFGPQRPWAKDFSEEMHMALADRHYVFIAGRRLIDAVDGGELGEMPTELKTQLTTLRDVFEHPRDYGIPGASRRRRGWEICRDDAGDPSDR